jgi:hypothetical protein
LTGHGNISSFKDFLGDSSRQTADIAVNFLTEHPEHFNEALDLALADIPLTSMRAARVIYLVTEKMPGLGSGIINEVIPKFTSLKEVGALRGLLKMTIPYVSILDEENDGILINCCFNWIESPGTKPAIHVYSLEILYEMSKKIPELKPELIAFLQHRNEERSPGIKSRSMEILDRLYKEIIS